MKKFRLIKLCKSTYYQCFYIGNTDDTSIEVLLPFNWLEVLPIGSNGSARPIEF